jgi:hypothetical protein
VRPAAPAEELPVWGGALGNLKGLPDRGLLSLDNLEALQDLSRACNRHIEFILAVPGRR